MLSFSLLSIVDWLIKLYYAGFFGAGDIGVYNRVFVCSLSERLLLSRRYSSVSLVGNHCCRDLYSDKGNFRPEEHRSSPYIGNSLLVSNYETNHY